MGDDLAIGRVISGFDADHALCQPRIMGLNVAHQLVASRARAYDQPLRCRLERGDDLLVV
jgi:hypothetical protein